MAILRHQSPQSLNCAPTVPFGVVATPTAREIPRLTSDNGASKQREWHPIAPALLT